MNEIRNGGEDIKEGMWMFGVEPEMGGEEETGVEIGEDLGVDGGKIVVGD